ncbi:MAG: outer membrane protein assembly factor BamC [Burkholderiales bacterium]|nr:outer membrane protein assembly factor BamC [Burkholderiales bacterium]
MTQHPAPSPALKSATRHTLALLAVCGLAVSGCSTFQETKVDYTSAKRINTLDVPPDLTQLSKDSRFAMPGGPVSASGYQVSQASSQATPVTAANSVGDVRIERAGSERWLVVKRPADALWEPVRGFWQDNGFVLVLDQEKLGLLETDWAENRAKLPQDFIRNTLGKLLDSLYSTGERDKFRTRLERNAAGETEIYVSHRGMVEVFTSSSKDQTMWQPRPSDPELEAEFLRRLMVKLGASQEEAKAQLAVASAAPKARLIQAGGVPTAVEVSESFDRSWRRVGVTLDRSGFTVEDRNRVQGTYFVRYVAPTEPQKESGFLGKLFGSSKAEAKPAQYQVRVATSGDTSTVTVLNADGQPDASASAHSILRLLAQDLQ